VKALLFIGLVRPCIILQMPRSLKKQSVYLPIEMVPYVICATVLNLAIFRSPEVKNLYQQVKVDLNLKACKKMFSPFEHIDAEVWAKRLAKEAGYDYRKGMPPGNQMIVMRELIKGSQRIINRYTKRFSLMVALFPWLNKDMRKFGNDLNELIKVGFNNSHAREHGKIRVNGENSDILVQAILFQAYAETKGLKIDKVAELKSFNYGGKSYSINPEMKDQMSYRARRELTSESIEAGFESIDGDKVARIAEWWYQSRVVHNGPQEFCNYLLQEKEEVLDPAYLSNEIRICDIALGYEREKRGRRKAA
jgi:hypothetical protein